MHHTYLPLTSVVVLTLCACMPYVCMCVHAFVCMCMHVRVCACVCMCMYACINISLNLFCSMNVHVKQEGCMRLCWNKNVLKKNEEGKRKDVEKKKDKGQYNDNLSVYEQNYEVYLIM